jgi:uncharacterized protein
MNTVTPETRIAVLARMVKSAPGQSLGRTQVMKLFYFLQELNGFPLGYDFRLFNYGPFDSEVLSDLSSACGLGIVVEDTLLYPNGYGYAIKPGPRADRFEAILASDNVLGTQIDLVIREFGAHSASELELRSTVLFVDREFAGDVQEATADQISDRVKQIKPHFNTDTIRKRVLEMAEKGHLQNLCSSSA